MTLKLYLLFVIASALLVATPGPNVALIVGTSLGQGARNGFLTMAGVNLGLTLQLSAIAAGLSWIVDVFAHHFNVIRYAGAAYLALLGVQQLLAKTKSQAGEVAQRQRGARAFVRGFAVAFANPKTLVFHMAFLPQFLTGSDQSLELWLLAATFAIIAAIGDSLYVFFASRVRSAASGRAQRVADKAAGAILVGGAGVLLAVRR
jgi:homoserine/homoserine lactone efflux protein